VIPTPWQPPLWLGACIDGGTVKSPFLAGYLLHDYEDRPRLLWSDGRQLVAEDLNAPSR
jgi:hypothetical protein